VKPTKRGAFKFLGKSSKVGIRKLLY